MQNRINDIYFTSVISLCGMVRIQNIIFVGGVWDVVTKKYTKSNTFKKESSCPSITDLDQDQNIIVFPNLDIILLWMSLHSFLYQRYFGLGQINFWSTIVLSSDVNRKATAPEFLTLNKCYNHSQNCSELTCVAIGRKNV